MREKAEQRSPSLLLQQFVPCKVCREAELVQNVIARCQGSDQQRLEVLVIKDMHFDKQKSTSLEGRKENHGQQRTAADMKMSSDLQ